MLPWPEPGGATFRPHECTSAQMQLEKLRGQARSSLVHRDHRLVHQPITPELTSSELLFDHAEEKATPFSRQFTPVHDSFKRIVVRLESALLRHGPIMTGKPEAAELAKRHGVRKPPFG